VPRAFGDWSGFVLFYWLVKLTPNQAYQSMGIGNENDNTSNTVWQ
jgi:hypothetical protein